MGSLGTVGIGTALLGIAQYHHGCHQEEDAESEGGDRQPLRHHSEV